MARSSPRQLPIWCRFEMDYERALRRPSRRIEATAFKFKNACCKSGDRLNQGSQRDTPKDDQLAFRERYLKFMCLLQDSCLKFISVVSSHHEDHGMAGRNDIHNPWLFKDLFFREAP